MERLIIYLFFGFAFILLINKKWEFIYILPIFNILSDISFNYFDTLSAPTLLRAFILVIFLFFFRSSFKKFTFLKSLIFYIAYTFLLFFFSSEFIYSLKSVSQVVISMSMFFVGYTYCNIHFRFQKLIKNLYWILVIGVVATMVGYFFGIGKILEYTATSEYEGGPERVGLLGSGGLYAPAIVLGLIPFILKYKLYYYKKWFLFILSFILFIFIMLNVRRTAIFIPVAGIFSYLLLTKSKTSAIKFILLGIIIMGLSSPLYRDLLEKRFKIREQAGRFEKDFYTSEDRYLENIDLFKRVIDFNEPLKIITGIGNNIFAEHVKDGKIVRRMYHTDSAKILYGEGLLGLVLYITVYIQILLLIIRIPRGGYLSDIRAGAFALWIISIFVSFNGSINLITFRSLNFLLLGSFISIAQTLKKQYGSLLPLQKGE